ncbi:hypothetical protein L0128_22840 [candidate division KSB1 bacterium]|nr:hypothetical protein [candidate division KSB1 bacterium]
MNQSMKRGLIVMGCLWMLLNFLSPLLSQTESQPIWSSNSAQLLPAGRFETGIFQPLRCGWSKSLEFSAHPMLFFVVPNFAVKWAHGRQGAFWLTTRHSLYYPTWLLQTISREGTGGIISPEFEIPNLLVFGNELLVSRPLHSQHLVTAKLGFKFALKSDEFDERTSIDLPLVYHRFNVLYHGYQILTGLDFNGQLYKRWHYLIDADWFYTPRAENKTGLEHKGMLLWNKSQRFQVSFGYKLIYGEYPFGTQWHWLFPLLDCQWAWQRK